MTTTIGSLLYAGVASAQASEATGNRPQADQNQLEEVVVTATRQTDTVNRVPLSVTAQTQTALDQQGIKSASDLQGTIPALTVSQARGPGVANLTIRGISDLQAGAATTGFYLDDTSLTKRATGSTTTASGNGSPVPPLFDLERIEVLRGPQGTLYGGSSEGGTVRYITPAPSLTRYSSYARAEVAKIDGGETNYEAGVAIGGPLIQDKLGFRVSVFGRNDGGWQDYVSVRTGQVVYDNANDGESRVLRGALTWAPNANARVTFAYLTSKVQTDANNFNGSTLSTSGPIVVPQACFNTSAITPARPNQNPTPVGFGPTCGAMPGVTFVRPGFTIPQLTFGDDDVVMRGQQARLGPIKTLLTIPTLTIDYNFPKMSVRSITSYIQDITKLENSSGLGQVGGQNSLNFTYGTINAPGGVSYVADQNPEIANNNSIFYSRNERYGISQEVRFSSAGDARLSWVAGVYYANTTVKTRFDDVYFDIERVAQTLYGISTLQRYGTVGLEVNGLPGIGQNRVIQSLKDVEIAAFGEANFWVIPDKLRLTAGLRLSRVSFTYSSFEWGPQNNLATPFQEPSATQPQGRGVSAGSTSESPVTPKVGAQYQFTDNKMIYATASKGFRAGGVTQSIPLNANVTLAPFGLTAADIPTTYKSDTVWSYELGAKFRLLNNRLQLNAAVYRIDWSDMQLSSVISGGVRFTTNAASARSQGVEVEAQARLLRGLTANVAFGYTDAKILETVISVPQRSGFSPFISAAAGTKLPVPPYTLNIGARYEVQIGSARAYARGDWRWQAAQKGVEATIFGNAAYAPDNRYVDTNTTNVRVGVEYRDFDINLFSNNLFNKTEGNVTGGRTNCSPVSSGGTAECLRFQNYNPFFVRATPYPRTIGLQIAYRH